MLIDDLDRLENDDRRNVTRLCVHLDDAASTDIVILGVGPNAAAMDRRLLRRASIRQKLAA